MKNPSPQFVKNLEKQIRSEFKQFHRNQFWTNILQLLKSPTAILSFSFSVFLVFSFLPIFPNTTSDNIDEQITALNFDQDFSALDTQLDGIINESL